MAKRLTATERAGLRRILERERELSAQEPGFAAKPVEPCNDCEEKKKKRQEKEKREKEQKQEVEL